MPLTTVVNLDVVTTITATSRPEPGGLMLTFNDIDGCSTVLMIDMSAALADRLARAINDAQTVVPFPGEHAAYAAQEKTYGERYRR